METLLTNFLKYPAATFKLINDLLLKNNRQQMAPKLTNQSNIETEARLQRVDQNDLRAVAVMLSPEARKSSVGNSKQLKQRKNKNNKKNKDEK